jgi:hypothetical protein
MAPQVGLEPTTNRLTADCSTTELLRNIAWQRPTLPGAMPQVPSALKSLTVVFGMGTCVTSSPSSPDNSILSIISTLLITHEKQGQELVYNV